MSIPLSPVQISRMGPADLEELRSIGRDTFIETFATSNTEANMAKYLAEEFTTDKLMAELLNAGSLFYAAHDDGRTVGYMKLNLGAAQTELKDQHALEIERIYVRKEVQGHGVGLVLYEQALKVANAHGVEFVWLGVWEMNHRAIAFYRKLGFEQFDSHLFTLGTDDQVDLMMKLVLPSGPAS